MKPTTLHPTSALAGAALATAVLLSLGSQGVAGVQGLPSLTPEQREILAHLSLVYLDDGQGGLAKTVRLSGANLQIVNGLGATNGLPGSPDAVDPLLTKTDGTGNLIVGYNELRSGAPNDRTGSHNIVTGKEQDFASFGGLIAGRHGAISGVFATIGGGRDNTADGPYAAVSAGWDNTASGESSAVSGGRSNFASGDYSSVSGGGVNSALGAQSTVSGGDSNHATGIGASVTGGTGNQAVGRNAIVVGGLFNVASGDYSVIGGGAGREVSGEFDWRAGLLLQDE